MERKSEWFCGGNFFYSNFKVEWENGVWTKVRYLASGLLFTRGKFTLIFTVFRFFWIGFFLNGFPNSLIVRSRSSFLFCQWKFMNCTSGLVLLCFFIEDLNFFYLFLENKDYEDTLFEYMFPFFTSNRHMKFYDPISQPKLRSQMQKFLSFKCFFKVKSDFDIDKARSLSFWIRLSKFIRAVASWY